MYRFTFCSMELLQLCELKLWFVVKRLQTKAVQEAMNQKHFEEAVKLRGRLLTLSLIVLSC